MTNTTKEVECGFFGCIFDDPESRIPEAINEGVKADWFTEPEARLCCKAMLSLHEKRMTNTDFITILNEATRLGETKGSEDYGTEIKPDFYDRCSHYRQGAAAEERSDIHNYSALLRDAHIRRQANSLLLKGKEILTKARPATESLGEIISNLQVLTATESVKKGYDLSSMADEIFSELNEGCEAKAHGRETKPSGIPLPWEPMNKLLGGFQPGGVHIIAARPSVGKTTLVMQLMNYWIRRGYHIAFNCIDMGPKLNLIRYFCEMARVSTTTLGNFNLTSEEMQRLKEARDTIKGWEKSGLYEVRSAYDINDFRNWCIARHSVGKLDVAVVDYVQQFKLNGSRKNEYERLTDISAELKSIAIELNIPVVLLSQLNRDTVKDGGGSRAPAVNDLRGSGALEQDAFSVSLLYHDESVKKLWETNPPAELVPYDNDDTGKYNELLKSVRPVVWDLAKNQNGQTGKIPMVAYSAIYKWFLGDITSPSIPGNTLPRYSKLTVDYRENEFPLKQLQAKGKVIVPPSWRPTVHQAEFGIGTPR